MRSVTKQLEVKVDHPTAMWQGRTLNLPGKLAPQALDIHVPKGGPDGPFFFAGRGVVCCGRPLYDCGFLDMAERYLRRSRDAAFVEGYNSPIHLERAQTILQGATHCNFRYSLGDKTV